MKVFEFGLDEKDMEAISALNQNLRKIVPINKVKLDKIILYYNFSILASSSAFPNRISDRNSSKIPIFLLSSCFNQPFF